MAEYHAKRFAGIDGLRVAAVCDHLPIKARAFAEARGLRAFAGPADMAASGEVDAFAIASFDGWHRAPALAAFDRGLPVFCEKPLARTLPEAEEMSAAAALSGLPAMVNFSKRNGGLLSLARRIAEGGDLGSAPEGELTYRQSWLLQDSWGDHRTATRWRWRLSEALSTHGALGDLGSHLFDAALLLAGGGLAVSRCSAKRYVEESGEALEGGGAFESFDAALEGRRMRAAALGGWREEGKLDAFVISVKGEKGFLELDLERSRSSLLLVLGGLSRELRAEPQASTYERFAAVASGAPDPELGEPIDFARGLAVQRLVEDCARLAGP
jgi:predicted dehydrogenase